MTHAEAVQLREQQSAAFWNSGAGTVTSVLMGLGLFFGIPFVVAGIVFGATAAMWSPVFMIGIVAVIFIYTLCTTEKD